MREIFHLLVTFISDKVTETTSVIGGLISFILFSIPTDYEFELYVWKFIFGFTSSIVYAIVGWHIKQWLEKRKNTKDTNE